MHGDNNSKSKVQRSKGRWGGIIPIRHRKLNAGVLWDETSDKQRDATMLMRMRPR